MHRRLTGVSYNNANAFKHSNKILIKTRSSHSGHSKRRMGFNQIECLVTSV